MPQEDNLQLIPLLKLCSAHFIRHWLWFALSVAICVACGWLYTQCQPRVFQRQAVMLIEDADVSDGMGGGKIARRSNMSSLLELNGVSVGDNLKNEIFILSSQRLMERVVDKLRLDVDYTAKEGLHAIALYGRERPFEILFQSPAAPRAVSFAVRKIDGNSCLLTDFRDKEGHSLPDQKVRLGETVRTPAGKLSLVRGQSFNRWENEEITVTRLPKDMAAKRFAGEINASEFDKESSLIVISCNDVNVQRGDDILRTLFEAYKEDVVENKNRVALNTAKFIDERIELIGNELGRVESRLAEFKKRNQLVDFEHSAQTVVTEAAEARQQSLQTETQLKVAEYLGEYVADHANDHDLIPALNIGDASFNSQIASYNEAMNKRNLMAGNSSEQQAVVRDMDRQLAQMRTSIGASIRSYVQSLRLRLNEARLNEAQISGKISHAPDQEKHGLDIQRQQSLKENLYTYLLNKREEVALQQAVNEANVRLVEGPLGGIAPISPRTNLILLVSLIAGLLIPALVIWLIETADVTIHGRSDLEANTSIPLLGEVPRLKNASDDILITRLESNAPIVEAFRILRFSLSFMRHSTQVIVTTFTTPGQGKSFISRNLAAILAMAGKRVLLVDADIRKRTLSLSVRHKSGLTSFLADEYTQLSDIIIRDGIAKGVDFLPAGTTPPNPAELLETDRLQLLTTQLRTHYDHIIYDTTPMFSVADASIIDRQADLTLYVVRAGVQSREFLPTLERLYKEKRFKNLCLVLNDADVKAKSYGAGYGYGYGYGYTEVKQRNKRSLNPFKRFRPSRRS